MPFVDFRSGTQLQRGLRPNWLAEPISDFFLLRRAAKLNAAAFPVSGLELTTTAAAAAGTGVSVAVDRVPKELSPGAVLDFGAGFARVEVLAPISNSPSTITATVVGGITNGATAYYAVGSDAAKEIPSGTPISRASAAANYGPALGAHNDFYLLAMNVMDANKDSNATVLRHGAQIHLERLPNWSGLATAVQDKIRQLYVSIPVSSPKFTV